MCRCVVFWTVIGPRLFKIRAAIARKRFTAREAGYRPVGPGADCEPAQQARQLTPCERVGLALIVWAAPGVPSSALTREEPYQAIPTRTTAMTRKIEVSNLVLPLSVIEVTRMCGSSMDARAN